MKLRFTIRDLLWLTAPVIGGLLLPATDFAQQDPKQYLEIAGKWQGQGMHSSCSLEFGGEKLIVITRNGLVAVPYILSTTADNITKSIDIENELGWQKGIYRIQNGMMTLSLNDPGGIRPKNFDKPAKNSGSNIVVYLFSKKQ